MNDQPHDVAMRAVADEIAADTFVVDTEGEALVRGRGAFIADIELPGMREVAFLRSPIARARIADIDVSEAKAAPGVTCVVTGRDIWADCPQLLPRAAMVLHPSEFAPEKYTLPAYPLLPVDALHFEGEAVAMVVAETRYLAEDAVDLISLDYEEQVPVLDPEQSLAQGCEQLFEDVPGNCGLDSVYGSTDDPGDAFTDAALVLNRRYRMNRSGNPPLEPLGVVASYDGVRLTVWATIQRPHMLRVALSDILGIPNSRVRVIAPPNIGGGFGWKSPMHREIAAIAWLATKVGHPVRWIEDRTEALKKGVHERDQIWNMEAAFDADGRIRGLRSEVVADIGSLLVDMYGLLPARLAVTMPFPYDIPWMRTHLRCALTNKAPMGVNRPAGRMPSIFAVERLMDDAARQLGITPSQIRMRNFVRQFPYVSRLGGVLYDSDYVGTLGGLLQAFRYDERVKEAATLRSRGRRVGVGIAVAVELCRPLCSITGSMFYNQPQYAAVILRMHPDGSVSILSGDAPQGQARSTTMARVVARELGADPARIEVYTGDTLLSPVTNSNTDVTTVCAVASRGLRTKLLKAASLMLKVDFDERQFSTARGVVTYLPDGRQLSFRDIAWTVIMRPFLLPEGYTPDLMEAAYSEAPYSPTAFGTHAAMVEVDAATGQLKILAYGFVGDAGKVMNPRGLRTAVTAGIATGISNTLYEAYIYDDHGQLITSNLKDYAMLTAPAMPQEIIIEHHDTPTAATIYGQKRTISEGVPSGVPPAIINAVIDAFEGGIDITTVPIFPADLWKICAGEGAMRGAAS